MGGLLNGLGSLITGQNPQAQASTNAANSATNSQNQLIQQSILPLFNQENQNYQTNQQPLQGGISSGYQGLLQNGQQAGGAGQALTNYGSQPQNTNLAQLTPQIIQQLLSGGALGQGTSGVGGQVLSADQQQMTQGLSPQLQQQGLGQQQQGFDQQISDIRNMLGSGAPINSSINQLGYANDQARAGLSANYAGQSQGLMNQGAANTLSTASGLTNTANQSGLSALGAGSGLDAQTLALLQSAYGTAGSSLTGAQGYAQQGLTNENTTLAGYGGLAGQYGQAAGTAATNAQNAYNTQNQQFTGLANAGMGLAGTLLA
jgi:hypothetical protein